MPSLTAIGHRGLAICNPVGEARLERAIELLALGASARVLDLGCGKGELLRRIAVRSGARGVGVDRDPDLVAEGEALVDGLPVELVLGDAVAYLAGATGFDAVCALGASHIWGGVGATLRALAAATAPGGAILVGEGFWAAPPDPAYLAAIDGTPDELPTLPAIIAAGEAAGLEPLDASPASPDEWDRYEWAHLRNVLAYARERPDDADAQALAAERRRWRDAYLTWGRATLGFGLFLFRRPA